MSKNHNYIVIRFASTYFIVVILVLLCLIPIFNSLIQAEEEKIMQQVYDQADTAAAENIQESDDLFTATRNLYSDPKLLEVFYEGNHMSEESLFYHMTLLQERLKLYYQNMEHVDNVLLFVPKFDYVLTSQYIFRSRFDYYRSQKSALYPQSDWLFELKSSPLPIQSYTDQITDLLSSEPPDNFLQYAYTFPQIGDANIQILVLVSLAPDALARQFILPDIEDYSFSLVSSAQGQILSSYHWNGASSLPQGSSWSDPKDQLYRLIHINKDPRQQICIGIREDFFTRQKYTAAWILFRSIGFALVLSAILSLLLAYYRSRPIERILGLLRTPLHGKLADHWKEIESSLSGMSYEISKCKQTIHELDDLISQQLLEKFYFGSLDSPKLQESFQQHFGALPPSFMAVVFCCEDENITFLPAQLSELLGYSNPNSLFLHLHHGKLYALIDAETCCTQLTDVVSHLRLANNLPVKAGVSDKGHSAEDIRYAVTQAMQRLRSGKNIPNLFVFNCPISAVSSPSFVHLQELETLQRSLLQRDYKASSRIIDAIFTRIHSMHYDQVDLRQLFFSIRTVYSNALSHLLQTAESQEQTLCLASQLPAELELYTLETIQDVFFSINQQLSDLSQKIETQSANTRGLEIVQFIEKNFRDPNLCANSLAEHFQLSEKYIFQLVKQTCGETLSNHICTLRIQEAITLLESTNMPIMEIAQQVGLSSSNTMYKVFMRVKGVPPSSYRFSRIEN